MDVEVEVVVVVMLVVSLSVRTTSEVEVCVTVLVAKEVAVRETVCVGVRVVVFVGRFERQEQAVLRSAAAADLMRAGRPGWGLSRGATVGEGVVVVEVVAGPWPAVKMPTVATRVELVRVSVSTTMVEIDVVVETVTVWVTAGAVEVTL